MRHKTISILLLLIFFMPASGAMTVSPSPVIVDSTLSVSGLPPGANVAFILNAGVPVFAVADASGTARYLPLSGGSLEIIVMQNGTKIDGAAVPVLQAAATPNATTTAAKAASTPVAGTGGGTGGGAGITEPYENIEKGEKIEKNLISNTPTTYNYTVPGIYQIVVTGAENENLMGIKVEALKGTSKLVTAAPPGTIFKNLNVWADTKRIKKAVIKFKVENSWMQGNNLAGSDIKMLRFDGSKWVQIDTKETGREGTYVNFEAATGVLANFAITGLKGETVPTALPAAIVTETATRVTQTEVKPETTAQAAVPTPKATGFEIVLVIAALCVLYIFRRR